MTTTPCYLTVLSRLDDTQITELAALIKEANADDMDIEEALSENSVIRFESMFEGDIPTDIQHWFYVNGVYYTWEWEAYYNVGAGCNYYDAAKDKVHTIRMHENLPVIPLTSAIDPKKVTEMSNVMIDINWRRNALGLT